MLYKLYSSGGAWLDVRELYNALQHVCREGGCEELREDMVPQHHPAYSAPPDTSPNTNTIPDLLGCLWCCCWFPGVIHTRLHGKRAVERYTADTHPTTGLQSYTAYTALYSVVYLQLYSLYIIQHYTITL